MHSKASAHAHLEVAATLRASPWDRFFTVALPLSARGLLTAAVLRSRTRSANSASC